MRKQAIEDIKLRKLELSLYRQLALAMLALTLVAFPQPIVAVWNCLPVVPEIGHDVGQGIAAFAAMFFGIGLLTEKYEPIIWENGALIKTPKVIKRLRRNFSRR